MQFHNIEIYQKLMTFTMMAINMALYVFLSAFTYMMICFRLSDTGFFSWHPIKRILAILFFPLILAYKILSRFGNCCGCCNGCSDD